MKKSIFVMGFTLLAAFSQAQVQDDTYTNPILTAVPSLGINPDAVGGGMGDIGVSTKPGLSDQYWNSSKYAMSESPGGFAISYTPWMRKIVGQIDLAQIAGFYKISDIAGTVSASLRYFSVGDVVMRQSANDLGYTVSPHEFAFDAGYSRKLAENFSMGVNIRLISSDLSVKQDDYHPGFGVAADINGFLLQPIDIPSGESKLGFGFNISNIGTKISYDKGNTSNFLPTTLRLGLSYYIPFDQYNRLSISAETYRLLVPSQQSRYTTGFDKNDPSTWQMTSEQYSQIGVMKGIGMSFADAPNGFKEEMQEFNWALGAEYSYNEMFFVRAGYSNEAKIKGNRKYFTFGAGFKWTAFRIDVGYVVATAPQSPIDGILRFTLAFDADGLKDLAK